MLTTENKKNRNEFKENKNNIIIIITNVHIYYMDMYVFLEYVFQHTFSNIGKSIITRR